MTEQPLIHNSDTDYEMHPAHKYVWITVGNISVYIKREDEGVVVDLYPLEQEMHEPIAGTYGFFSDAELQK